ncbi:hypothetical protein BJ741DRAFT_621342 [Chytriomyces cf. hyalinus JEL632]|nr:hypothetical protein BJ741DRAFT_621342 [Chytriomyces cf. hyalinus JEL632]
MFQRLTTRKSTLTIRNVSPSPERESRSRDIPTALPSAPIQEPTPLSTAPASPSPPSSPTTLSAAGSPPTQSTTTSMLASLLFPKAAQDETVAPTDTNRVVPLIAIQTVKGASDSDSTKYVPLGVTPQAASILSGLPGPVSIAVFAGFGRSGKSLTASRLAKHLGVDQALFASKPGNIPCTHGIDMAVVKHPRGRGHILLLDCEGAANHNQSAIPFVMGLAARLASKIYVFERGCFTTAGLESVMQIVNMGLATMAVQDDNETAQDITRSLTLIENMTINTGIPTSHLLQDLLSPRDGDEMSNRVKRFIRDQFDVQFEKLPFFANEMAADAEFNEVCQRISSQLVDAQLKPLEVGGVPADGSIVVQLCNELLAQIRDGGSRFNMVSATESLVSNMATEAANTVWADFITRARNSNNTPQQINGRKHLRTILRELEGFANMALIDLEAFTCRLVPQEPASIARIIWDRNFDAFMEDVRTAHAARSTDVQKTTVWAVRMNHVVVDMVEQFVEAARQLVRLARFGSMLVMLTNYYFWKHGVHLIKNVANGVIAEMVD